MLNSLHGGSAHLQLTRFPFNLRDNFRLAGSYEALSGGLVSEALTDFTGGLTERFNFSNELPDNMFQIMNKAKKKGSLMGCSIDVSFKANPHTALTFVRALSH